MRVNSSLGSVAENVPVEVAPEDNIQLLNKTKRKKKKRSKRRRREREERKLGRKRLEEPKEEPYFDEPKPLKGILKNGYSWAQY
jgi:hypothetical protein